MAERILQITAPHFCAGAIFTVAGVPRCKDAAPIIKWMIGKPAFEVTGYCGRKGWKFVWSKVLPSGNLPIQEISDLKTII